MHYYNSLNPYKICRLGIGGYNLENRDNWRNFASSHTGNLNIAVRKSVLLFSQNKEWDISYTNSYESAWSHLDQKGGLGKISQISETLRSVAMMKGSFGDMTKSLSGGRFLPRYSKAPAWSGTSPLSLSNSITFEFRFGMANIFSGLREVVIPIIALAIPWAPYQTNDAYSNLDTADYANYFNGPLPTGPTYLWHFLSTFGKNVVGDFKSSMEKHREANEAIARQNEKEKEAEKDLNNNGRIKEKAMSAFGEAVNALTALENSLRNGINKAINDVLVGNIPERPMDNRFIHLTIGNFSLPPMIVKEVSWKFDMTHTDNMGYPTAGSITLGGLEAVELANDKTILSIINEKTGITGEYFLETPTTTEQSNSKKGGAGDKFKNDAAMDNGIT